MHSSFKGNIWGTGLANMQIISKYSKGIRFLPYVINSFCKYSWIIYLKDKEHVTVTSAFQKLSDKSKQRKPNKKRVIKGGQFFNRS